MMLFYSHLIVFAAALFLGTVLEAASVSCVVQAFGDGLGGKVFRVKMKEHGFGCVSEWNQVSAQA